MTFVDSMHVGYFTAAVLFVLSIKGLARTATVSRGLWLGAAGVAIAALATLVHPAIYNDANEHLPLGYGLIFLAAALGAGLGAALAFRTESAALDDAGGVLAGLGGGAAALATGGAVHALAAVESAPSGWDLSSLASAIAALTGAVSLGGCVTAFMRLQGIALVNPLAVPARSVICLGLAALAICFGGWLTASPSAAWAFWGLAVAAGIWGAVAMATIDMSDLPLGIKVCGAFAGPAATAAGLSFLMHPLAIGGALVSAAAFVHVKSVGREKERSPLGLLLGAIPSSNSKEGTS